jgi:hypothetical protein
VQRTILCICRYAGRMPPWACLHQVYGLQVKIRHCMMQQLCYSAASSCFATRAHLVFKLLACLRQCKLMACWSKACEFIES